MFSGMDFFWLSGPAYISILYIGITIDKTTLNFIRLNVNSHVWLHLIRSNSHVWVDDNRPRVYEPVRLLFLLKEVCKCDEYLSGDSFQWEFQGHFHSPEHQIPE